jgi:hypothetical protein
MLENSGVRPEEGAGGTGDGAGFGLVDAARAWAADGVFEVGFELAAEFAFFGKAVGEKPSSS